MKQTTPIKTNSKEQTVTLPHQWPFPYSNGRKVITPAPVEKKKTKKKDYLEALL